MTGKITAAVVAAILLSSAGVASAQTGRTRPTYSPYYSPYNRPYYNSYYDRQYWQGVAPAGRIHQRDPYGGTVFDDVAPY
jgi:hypothetical protein